MIRSNWESFLDYKGQVIRFRRGGRKASPTCPLEAVEQEGEEGPQEGQGVHHCHTGLSVTDPLVTDPPITNLPITDLPFPDSLITNLPITYPLGTLGGTGLKLIRETTVYKGHLLT